MLQRRRLRRTALCAVAATASLAVASPVWAAPGGHNPTGDNGTVKLDGVPFTDKVDNEPHVTCGFEVEFFNFDEGQRADITLTAQPPSGRGAVVKSLVDRVISDDDARGAENDHDAVIRFSDADLDLDGLGAHPKQGYHLKLTVELAGGHGAGKHKVFWLQPCQSSPPSPSDTPPPPSDTPPPVDGNGNGGGGGATGESGGSLPITGVAATSIALGGLALVGAGTTLLVLRRRRAVTFES